MTDITTLERAAAKRAARMLKQELMRYYPAFRNRKSVVKKHRSEKDFLSGIKPRFRQGFLDRLVIDATKYSFHVHYGYDLVAKSEWEKRHRSRKRNPNPPESRDVPGTMHFVKALSNSKALNMLADELSHIRFIQVGNYFKQLR